MKVRLKPAMPSLEFQRERSFNSMKVRLKHSASRLRPHHTQFQFHEGPIKAVLSSTCANYTPSFNSMKVRLKQRHRADSITQEQFQFHEGPIKALTAGTEHIGVLRFNSMKVRLKPPSRCDGNGQYN